MDSDDLSQLPKRPIAGQWDQRLVFGRNSFDIIRLALAIMVVFEHSYFLPYNSPVHEPLYNFSNGQIDFGALGVDFFFVLSGFLIVRSWQLTNRVSLYFQKRIARIVPGFVIASIIGTFIIGPLASDDAWVYFNGLNLPRVAIELLSLHQSGAMGAFTHNPMDIIDGTLWTIKYEFDCYLFVALLGICGWLRRIPVTLIFVASLSSYFAQKAEILQLSAVDHGIFAVFFSSPIHWPRFLSYFFGGAAFYLWRDHIPKTLFLFWPALLMVAASLRFGGAEVALVTAGIYCIFFIALSAEAVPRIFGKRVDLSYGIYLFGFPIQQLLIAWSVQTISPVWLFVISMPATCFIAFLSWNLIELPSLQREWLTWPKVTTRSHSR